MAEPQQGEAARQEWCGSHEPHGQHEWLKGVRRMDCPGMYAERVADRPVGGDRQEQSTDLGGIRDACSGGAS